MQEAARQQALEAEAEEKAAAEKAQASMVPPPPPALTEEQQAAAAEVGHVAQQGLSWHGWLSVKRPGQSAHLRSLLHRSLSQRSIQLLCFASLCRQLSRRSLQ